KEVKNNMKNYLKQAAKVIDLNKAEIHYNSEWLEKLNTKKLLQLLMLVSVQQILEREDFHTRIAQGKSLRLHEILYPVFQGYDSVMVKSDIEIGGSDQKFNFLMGRTLMEKFGLKPQDILTVPLIEGIDGIRKMSKSYNNYIGINDLPDDMFGKIMSIPDNLIDKYFILLLGENPIHTKNPRDAKLELAFKIVQKYYNSKKAQQAKDNFIKLFSKKEIGNDIPELKIAIKKINIIDLLVKAGIQSKSEARRLILQKAIDIDNVTKTDINEIIELHNDQIIKIGKKKFLKIKLI
ncbi:MAG: tyrosine--tRNA ligase, partial [Minisyncoccia bacterium]